MTFYQKTEDTGNEESNYITINNRRHKWFHYNQNEKCTKIKRIDL